MIATPEMENAVAAIARLVTLFGGADLADLQCAPGPTRTLGCRPARPRPHRPGERVRRVVRHRQGGPADPCR